MERTSLEPWDTLTAIQALERAGGGQSPPAAERRLAWARLVAASVAARPYSDAARTLGVHRRVVSRWVEAIRSAPDLAPLLVEQDPMRPAAQTKLVAGDAPWFSMAGRALVMRLRPAAEAFEFRSVWEAEARRCFAAHDAESAAEALGVSRRTAFRWKAFLRAADVDGSSEEAGR